MQHHYDNIFYNSFKYLSYLNQNSLIGGNTVISILFRMLANMKAQEKGTDAPSPD